MRMIVTYVIVDMFCIILAIAMGFHINQDFGSEFEVKALRHSLLSYCGFLIFGLIGILMENQVIAYIGIMVWVANMVSLMLLICVSYFWCVFATARLHNCFPNKWFLNIARIPLAVVGLLSITSPWTGAIFTINKEGIYQRGSLFMCVYFPIFLYGIAVAVQAVSVGVREKQHEKKKLCFVIGFFIMFPMVAGGLQVYLAGMPILAPAIITGFFLVFINIQSSQIYNDALTGLNNRRRAYHYLEEQLSLAGENKPVTVYLMDINSFKQINDQYGHAQGDEALNIIARALIKLCQQYHLFVARYGGDEFILVSTWRYQEEPEVVRKELHHLLKRECEEKGIPYSLSVSIGHAICLDGKEQVAQIVNRADQALYVEKRHYHGK